MRPAAGCKTFWDYLAPIDSEATGCHVPEARRRLDNRAALGLAFVTRQVPTHDSPPTSKGYQGGVDRSSGALAHPPTQRLPSEEAKCQGSRHVARRRRLSRRLTREATFLRPVRGRSSRRVPPQTGSQGRPVQSIDRDIRAPTFPFGTASFPTRKLYARRTLQAVREVPRQGPSKQDTSKIGRRHDSDVSRAPVRFRPFFIYLFFFRGEFVSFFLTFCLCFLRGPGPCPFSGS